MTIPKPPYQLFGGPFDGIEIGYLMTEPMKLCFVAWDPETQRAVGANHVYCFSFDRGGYVYQGVDE
ncbi:MAG: hypothetical protein KDA77_00280 [Planctomycetaceae bacterium]|nr:hypothetical protein [Planctomycetaceae bacterium]